MPESVFPSTSTDPSARSSLILLLTGVSDTNDSLTFAGVAGALPSRSFVSTLASTVFATFDDPLAESLPAVIEQGRDRHGDDRLVAVGRGRDLADAGTERVASPLASRPRR